MLLADAAQEVQGKLYVLGGGWSSTSTPTGPFGVAIRLDVPWDKANIKHGWSLRLLTEDGVAVVNDGPQGEQEIRIDGELEVGRPPGIPQGTPIDASMAFSFPPLTLAPGRYEWRFEIAGATETCTFTCVGRP